MTACNVLGIVQECNKQTAIVRFEKHIEDNMTDIFRMVILYNPLNMNSVK